MQFSHIPGRVWHIVNTVYKLGEKKTWTGKGLKDDDQGTTQLPESQAATVAWVSPASGERQTLVLISALLLC